MSVIKRPTAPRPRTRRGTATIAESAGQIFLWSQYDLADVSACLNVGVCIARAVEWKYPVDVWTYPAVGDPSQQDVGPSPNLLGLMPEVPHVDSEHRAVLVHERQRVKERHAQRGP